MKRARSWFLVLVAILLSTQAWARLKVVYPNVNEAGAAAFGYAALKLALENSGKEFDLSVSAERINNERIRALIKEKTISISDFGTSPEYERDLLPIHFPIDLGLNGWRIFLVHEKTRPIFQAATGIDDLRKLRAGQGVGWSDVKILEHAGLPVDLAPSMSNLFRMAEARRFDYFPLGANEAHSLLEQYRQHSPSLGVEGQLVLVYPFGRLFFVHKDNIELHDAVLAGLVKSFENGGFQKLLRTHESTAALFTRANLKSRRQIHIDNPFLTREFRKIPRKYFFNLKMLD